MESIKQRMQEAAFEFEQIYAPLIVSIPDTKALLASLLAYLQLDDEWQTLTALDSTADVDTLREHLDKAFYVLLVERGRIKIDDEIGLSTDGRLCLNMLKGVHGPAPKVSSIPTVKPLTLEEQVVLDYYGDATHAPLTADEQKKKFVKDSQYREAFFAAEKAGKLDRLSTHAGGI